MGSPSSSVASGYRGRKEATGNGGTRHRKKATANFRRICTALFDGHSGTTLQTSKLSSSDYRQDDSQTLDSSLTNISSYEVGDAAGEDEYEKLDFFQSKKQTGSLSSQSLAPHPEVALSTDDEYAELNFFQLKKHNGSACPTESLASRGGRLLKVFKLKASNLSSRTSASGNSCTDPELEGRGKSAYDKDVDTVSVDQLQVEVQILRQRLEKDEEEMQKLRNEVSSLRSGATFVQQPLPRSSGNEERTESSPDFSLSTSNLLKHEAKLMATIGQQETKDYMDAFLSDAAAPLPEGSLASAAAMKQVPEISALMLPDVAVSTGSLEREKTMEEYAEKYRDDDHADLKFMESESKLNQLDQLSAQSLGIERDNFNSGVGPQEGIGMAKASRSPPEYSLEHNSVALPSLPEIETLEGTPFKLRGGTSEATASDPNSPLGSWSSGAAADLDIALGEKRRAVKLRFQELEDKLLKSLNSFEIRRKELTTSSLGTTDRQIISSSISSIDSDSSVEEFSSKLSNSPVGYHAGPRRPRATVDFDKALGEKRSARGVETGYPESEEKPLGIMDSFPTTIETLEHLGRLLQRSNEASQRRLQKSRDRGTSQPQDLSRESIKLELPLAVREKMNTPLKFSVRTGGESAGNSRIDSSNLDSNSLLQPRTPDSYPRAHPVKSQLLEESPTPTSSSLIWQSSSGSPQESMPSAEVVGLEEDLRQCLEQSRLLLGDGLEPTTVNRKGGLIRKGGLMMNEQQHSSGRSSREASFSVLAVSRQRRSMEEKSMNSGARVHQHHGQASSVRENQSNAKSSTDPVEQKDIASTIPDKLCEAVDAWDKRRSDLELHSQSLGPKLPPGRQSRFFLEANASSPAATVTS